MSNEFESEYARGQRLLKERDKQKAKSEQFSDFLSTQDQNVVNYYKKAGYDKRETANFIIGLEQKKIDKANKPKLRTEPLIDSDEKEHWDKHLYGK